MDEKEIRERYRKISWEMDESERTREDWMLFEIEKAVDDLGDFKELCNDAIVMSSGGVLMTKAEYLARLKRDILNAMDKLGIVIPFEKFCELVKQSNEG